MKIDDNQSEEDFAKELRGEQLVTKEVSREFYQTEEKIKKWLNDRGVENFKIIQRRSKKFPFVVKANDVDLSNRQLDFIPVKFSQINGYLDCSKNSLSELSFCPHRIYGYLYFNDNNLSSLKGCPKTINGTFDISDNNLNKDSLIDFPQNIDDLILLKGNHELGDLQNIVNKEDLKEAINKFKEKLTTKNDLENEMKINSGNGKSGRVKV